MKKGSYLITILVVIAFFIGSRHVTPNVALPSTASVIGSQVTIPVVMKVPNMTDEFWGLSRRANGHYAVAVFNRGRLIRTFLSGDNTGKLKSQYLTTGTIEFNGILFTASVIQINADGKSGSITFTTTETPSANQVNSTINGVTN